MSKRLIKHTEIDVTVETNLDDKGYCSTQKNSYMIEVHEHVRLAFKMADPRLPPFGNRDVITRQITSTPRVANLKAP